MKRRKPFCAGVYFMENTAVILKRKKRWAKLKSIETHCLTLHKSDVINGLVNPTKTVAKALHPYLITATVNIGLSNEYIQQKKIKSRRLSHEQILYLIKHAHYDVIKQNGDTYCHYIEPNLATRYKQLAQKTKFNLKKIASLDHALITLFQHQLKQPQTLLALKIENQVWCLVVNRHVITFSHKTVLTDLAQDCLRACKLYESSHLLAIKTVVSNHPLKLPDKKCIHFNPLSKIKLNDLYLPAYALTATPSLNFLTWHKEANDKRQRRHWFLVIFSTGIIIVAGWFYKQTLEQKNTSLTRQTHTLRPKIAKQRITIKNNLKKAATLKQNQTLLTWLNTITTNMPNSIRLEKLNYSKQTLQFTAATQTQEAMLSFLKKLNKLAKTTVKNIKHQNNALIYFTIKINNHLNQPS